MRFLIILKDAPAKTEFTVAENALLNDLMKKHGTKWKIISRAWELKCKIYIHSEGAASSDDLTKDKKVYMRTKEQLEGRHKTIKDSNRSSK